MEEEEMKDFSKFQPIQFIQKLEQIAVEKDHIQRILQLLGIAICHDESQGITYNHSHF